MVGPFSFVAGAFTGIRTFHSLAGSNSDDRHFFAA
jgi:hypothetical protein